MKKYPDNLVTERGAAQIKQTIEKIDAAPKFMYVPDTTGGVSIFSIDTQTLDVLPQLKYAPQILPPQPANAFTPGYAAPLKVIKKIIAKPMQDVEGLEAECIYASPAAVEDMMTVPTFGGIVKPTNPEFKTLKAVHCALRECYRKEFLWGEYNRLEFIETKLAVYDQNKDFKGLVGLMYGR